MVLNLIIVAINFSVHMMHMEASHRTEQTQTILCFGNSITAGYNMDPEYAYPAILEEKLKKEGYDVVVINAGLSGETSAGGLERINWILKQPIDVFILELGGNDGLRGLPLDQTRKNLQSIIDHVKTKYPDTKVVVAGMMVPPNMGERYGNEFVKLYPELAFKNNATLIPFLLAGVGGDPTLNMPDGIHPNAEGHKILAENVLEAVKPLLKK